jgi:hypothetical protein
MKKGTIIGIAAFIIVAIMLIAFKPAITGYLSMNQAASSLFITGGVYGHACDFTLNQGWHLISILCDNNDTTIGYMLGTIEGQYSSIHGYDRNDSEDPWKSYNPGLPSWVEQDLTNITPKTGYWIYMNGTGHYYMESLVTLPGQIPLEPGWMLIGYPVRVSKTPTFAFSGVASNISSVHAYNASDSSDHWKVYVPTMNSSFNDLELMEPYWGYWINVTNASVWVMNEW